jgi:hypothetical protein
MVRQQEIDPAVTRSELVGEARDRLAAGDIEHLAADLRSRFVEFRNGLRDALGIAAGQVDGVGGVEAS